MREAMIAWKDIRATSHRDGFVNALGILGVTAKSFVWLGCSVSKILLISLLSLVEPFHPETVDEEMQVIGLNLSRDKPPVGECAI
jgi:hypothetical protein